jgi:hypothetical protein
VLLLVVVLGAGGWFGWHLLRSDDASPVAGPTPCRTSSPPPEPAHPGDVRLRVLNGTKRDGLAHELDKQLRHRGFHVVRVGNAKSTQHTTVVSAQDDLARVVAVRVHLQQFRWAPVAKQGKPVTLVIGHDFTGLASPDEVAAHRAAAVRLAHPTTPPCRATTRSS